jgi:TRAP-type C4-dicarboxylate transport system substrate-binding protein
MYIPDPLVGAQKFYEVTKFSTHTDASFGTNGYFLDRKRYDRLPAWVKPILAKLGEEIHANSFKVDSEWSARQTKVLEGNYRIYKPTAAELDQWHNGAVAAWVAAKGTFDPALARRALKEQGQDAFLKKLEAAKAL